MIQIIIVILIATAVFVSLYKYDVYQEEEHKRKKEAEAATKDYEELKRRKDERDVNDVLKEAEDGWNKEK